MALEGVKFIPLAYSKDIAGGRWTVIINNNKYDFFGVNPYIKRQLANYYKHNNKKEFFKLLRSLEYENLTKKKQQQKGDDQQQKGKGKEGGEQLNLFGEADLKRLFREELNNYFNVQ